MRGVDLSASYQPAENFPAVKAAGYSFAILKVTEGTTWPDTATLIGWYPARYAAARAAGLLVGAYHFAHPSADLAEARAEAAHFLGRVTFRPGDIVPMLDLETNPAGLTPAQLVAWAVAWLGTVDAHLPNGARAGVYTDVSYLRDQLGGWDLDGRPLWLADPSNVDPGQGRLITQTGQATVPGVGAGVDVNTCTSYLPLIPARPANAPPTEVPDMILVNNQLTLPAGKPGSAGGVLAAGGLRHLGPAEYGAYAAAGVPIKQLTDADYQAFRSVIPPVPATP